MLASEALAGPVVVGVVGAVDVSAVLFGVVFPVASVRFGASSSNNRSFRQAAKRAVGTPKSIATNPIQLLDDPRPREERRLTKIRLASKSYIMRPMHPPCGERCLGPDMTQALPLRSKCQEGGLGPLLRANFASMFSGQSVTSRARHDSFPRHARRSVWRRVRAMLGLMANSLEICA